jgi:threonine synthase
MDATDAHLGVDCTATGERSAPGRVGRSDAGAPLDPAYDLDAVDPAALPTDPDSMWGYDALLPLPASRAVSATEGATPLLAAPDLAADLGVDALHFKDEGRNPTGTVLDRGLSVAVSVADAVDAPLLALAAPGNAGQSAAAYAARADRDCYVYLPSRAPFPNKAMVNVHGGDMRVVGGRYPDAAAALESDLERDPHPLGAFETPYRHDGVKTLAYEAAAARDWTAPDAVVVPVGTGELLVGVERGFRDLLDLGVTDRVPRCYAVQPEGCAPVVDAHERGEATPRPPEYPDTICGELELPDPVGGALALDAIDATDGGATTVSDDDLLETAVTLTQRLGTEMGATGGAAAAGAWALAETGELDGDDVLLVNPDAGVKTADLLRSHLMGQGV